MSTSATPRFVDFEPLEDRLLFSATPVVQIDAPNEVEIGERAEVTVTFENSSATDVGYGPWVDVAIDVTGADGVAPGNPPNPADQYDGFSLASAPSYLGLTLNHTLLTLDNAANGGQGIMHPYAVDNTGAPVFVSSSNPASPYYAMLNGSFQDGDQLLVIELPFGSFSPDQPGAEITFDLNLSNYADLGYQLPIAATGGFRFGNDPLDNPAADPSIIGLADMSSVAVDSTLATLTKEYIGPENETATGPNFLRSYRINVDIANGQTISGLNLFDELADQIQFAGFGSSSHAYSVVSQPSTTTPGGDLQIIFNDPVTGTAGAQDAWIEIQFYIPRLDANGVAVNPAASGDDHLIDNQAYGYGNWDPMDPRDAAVRIGFEAAVDPDLGDPANPVPSVDPEHNDLEAQSIAIQKGFTNLTDGARGANEIRPGDLLEFTLEFQISDYFAFQNITIDDLLSDGLRLDSGFVPTLQINGNTYTLGALALAPANWTSVVNSDNNLGTPATDGSTALAFRVSNELIARSGGLTFDSGNGAQQAADAAAAAQGRLLGGGVNPASPTGTIANDLTGYNSGATTGTIVYRVIVQDAFTDSAPSGEAALNPRDELNNTVLIRGDVLDLDNNLAPTGLAEADDSGVGLRIESDVVQKAIYAINGSTNLAPYLDPNGNVNLQPGDVVTYRLSYTIPTGDVEALRFTDYLPLPVFNVGDPDADGTPSGWSFINNLGSLGGVPLTGQAMYGPSHTLDGATSAPNPNVVLSIDPVSNSLRFGIGNSVNTANDTLTVDLLFSVTVNDTPFADGLYLTNQVQSGEQNTQNPGVENEATTNAIVQIVLNEPVVNIYKGIVASSKIAAPAVVGGLTFANTSGSGFTGTLSGPANAAAIGNLNLTSGTLPDAGDRVRFALVAQNTGRSDAFNVTVQDTIRGSYVNNYANAAAFVAGTNFAVYRADGTTPLISNLADPVNFDYTVVWDAGSQTFTVEMADNYDGANTAGDDKDGGLSRGRNAGTGLETADGSNAVVILYDLTVDTDAQASSTIVNTATLTEYAGSETGGNHVPNGRSEDASVRIAAPDLAKTLVGTEFDLAGNNAANQAVIGELVTYTLVITVPEGTTAAATMVDVLDAGLAFVGIDSVVYSGGVSSDNTIGTGTNPAHVTVGNTLGGTGNQLTFLFGDIENTNVNNGVTETITITYTAVVVNTNSAPASPGNQAGTQLNNTATFSYEWTDDGTPVASGGDADIVRSSANVTVVEPVLVIDKQASADNVTYTNSLTGVDAGDTVYYRIWITNTAGGPTAFDLTLADVLPGVYGTPVVVSTTLTNATGGAGGTIAVTDGGLNTLSSDDFAFSGLTLGLSSGVNIDLAANSRIEIIISAVLDYSVNPDQDISNTARVAWSSLDGEVNTARSIHNPNSVERTGAGGEGTDGAVLNNYADSDAALVTISNLNVVKSIVATSEAHTSEAGSGTTGSPRLAAIGEIVRYRLVVTVPEGTTQNFQVQDNLPSGLQFLNDGTATITYSANAGFTSTNPAGSSLSLALGTALTGGTVPLPSANIGSSNSLTVDPDSYGNGTDIFFKLGDIVNTDSDGGAEQIIIEFNALVLNSAAANNNAGSNRDNTATVRQNGTSMHDSNTVRVRVVEPSITNVDKTVSAGPYDAGNIVTYTVTFSNANGANNTTAFDLAVTDILPAFLENVTIGTITSSGVVNGALQVMGNTLTFTADSMAAGGSVTFTYTAELVATVPAQQIITNTADLVYSSLPGAGTAANPTGSVTPGGSGADNGERDGSGTGTNDYHDSDTATLTVAIPVIDKQWKDGSLTADDTSVTSSLLGAVVIGETVTYDILITLPEGVTQGLRIDDLLPGGLRLDSYQVLTGMGDSALLTAAFGGSVTNATVPTVTLPASGPGTVTFDFGNVTTTDDGITTNNSFVLRVVAVVENDFANQEGVSLTNRTQLRFTNPNTAATTTVLDVAPGNDPTVTIDEATLTVNKQVASTPPVDAGDTLTYTITITNTSGQTGYDVTLSDAIDPSLVVGTGFLGVLSGSSVTASAGATVSANAFEIVDLGGGNFVLRTAAGANVDIPDGESVVLVYQATVYSGIVPGDAVSNTANVRWTSTDGANADERGGNDIPDNAPQTLDQSVAGPNLNDYALSSAVVTEVINNISVVKSLESTSEASTLGNQVTIGEFVTYRLTVTIPEGVAPDFQIQDFLPAGMAYVPGSVSLNSAGFQGTVALPAVSAIGGGNFLNGTDLLFDFSAITVDPDNNPGNNTFTISYTALVLDVGDRTPDGEPNDGLGGTRTELENVAYHNNGNGNVFAPGTATEVSVFVVEPELSITKNVVVNGAGTTGDAGDPVTYTITIQHTGNSSSGAFDLNLLDLLPAQLTGLTLVSATISDGAGGFADQNVLTSLTLLGNSLTTADNNGADAINLRYATGGAAGSEQLVVVVTGFLVDDLAPGAGVSNTATVSYTTLPNDGAAGNDYDQQGNLITDPAGVSDGTDRERITTVSDTVTITVPSTLNLDKIIFNTSLGGNDGFATIGETVDYRLTVTVQEGVTSLLTLTDNLPDGMQYVADTAVFRAGAGFSVTGVNTNTVYLDGDAILAADLADGGAGGDLVFLFKDVTVPAESGMGTGSFDVEYATRVLNVAGNQAETTPGRTNSATVSADRNGDGDHADAGETSGPETATVTIVEPELVVDKTSSITSGNAGDAITYTIEIEHSGASSSDAFDLTFSDTLPAHVVKAVVAGGADTPLDISNVTVTHSTAGDITGLFEVVGGVLQTIPGVNLDLLEGETITIQIAGVISDAIVPGQTVSNTASVTWSSLNGANETPDPNERTGSGGINDYTGSDGADFSTPAYAPLVNKQIIGTSQGSTSFTSLNGDVLIGEVVRYQLKVELYEGTLNQFVIVDNLPAGMLFLGNVNIGTLGVNSSVTGLTAGTAINPASSTVISSSLNADVDVYGDGTDVYFNFGTLINNDNDAGLEFVVIEFDALVMNVAGNQAGGTLSNSFQVLYDADNNPLTDPVAVTTLRVDENDDGTPETTGQSSSNVVTVTILEPELVLEKSHDDGDGQVSPGQILTYTLQIENTGTATAFNAAIADAVPEGMTLVPGSISISATGTVTGLSNTSAGANIAVSYETIEVGAVVTITYEVRVNLIGADPGENTAGDTIDNNARVSFTSLPGIDANERGYDPDAGIEVHDGTTDSRQDTERVTLGTGSIADLVWFDINGDGLSAGEQGIGGVEIALYESDGMTLLFTTVTAADGTYSFTGLAAGDYVVRVNTATLPDGAATIATYDLDGTTATPNGESAVNLAAGQNRTDVDFGYRGTGTIGDLVWLDLDGNASQNGLEPGIEGVTINLIWDENGNGVQDAGEGVVATLTTDASGAYDFTGLLAGSYIVDVTDINGVLANATLTGAVGVTDPEPVVITTGQDYNDADFGYRGAASIGDRVWNDFDADGIQDAGEFGIVGLTLNLYRDVDGNGAFDALVDLLIATTTTGANGIYNFGGLIAGGYLVEVAAPPASSTPTHDLDDPNTQVPVSPHVAARTLGANEQAVDVDFGYVGSARIGDYVWFDQNGDGVQDAGEPPLEGVRVFIDLNGDGYTPGIDPEYLTNAAGFYEFAGLIGGTYTVSVDFATLPAGLQQPTWDRDDLLVNPDGIAVVAVGPTDVVDTVDFGFQGGLAISGNSYHDRLLDGSFNGTDTGIGGVTIELIWDADGSGTVTAGDTVITSTLTAADGSYVFDSLIEGNYLVREVQPNGFGPGTEAGANVRDVVITFAGGSVADQNFGNTTGSIAGTVFRDDDNNGVQNGAEPGLAGVEVTLVWSQDATFGNGDDVSVVVTTDANGNYIFNYSTAGNILAAAGLDFGDTTAGLLSTGYYMVVETQPLDYLDGADAAGNASGTAGTVDEGAFAGLNGRGGADQIGGIQIGAGQAASGYNFGELTPAAISGSAYVDLNGNGAFDAFESGLAGVTITLTGTNDLGEAVNVSVLTGAGGAYSFTNLRPGTYSVTETQPGAYIDGGETLGSGFAPGAGNANGTLGADTFTNIVIANVAPGNNLGINYNFGETLAANPVKSIVATSEAHTAGSDLAIGEMVRYRLEFAVPYGTVVDVALLDNFLQASGLQFLPASARITFGAGVSSSLIAGSGVLPDAAVSASRSSNDDTYASGTDVWFKLGDLTNSNADGSPSSVAIEFDALVVNETANQAGTVLANEFELFWDRTGDGTSLDAGDAAGTSASVAAIVVEPDVTLTQVITADSHFDAGDTVTITLTLFNSGSSAFDLDLEDLLDSRFDLTHVVFDGGATGAVWTYTGNYADDTVTGTIDRLDTGESVTITLTATLRNTVAPEDILGADASLTWTSLPGAGTAAGQPGNDTLSSTPGVSGAANGERDGSGGVPSDSPADSTPLNNYAATASNTIQIATQLLVDKAVVEINGSGAQTSTVQVGDTVTYQLTVTVIEGTTANLKLVDALPAGVEFVAGSVTITDANGMTIAVPVVGYDSGTNTLTIDIASVVNGGTADANLLATDSFTLNYEVLVLNDLVNVTDGDTLANGVTATADNTPTDTDDTTVSVREPILVITKTTTTVTGDAGDVVTYTLTIEHDAASTGDAFDLVIQDLLSSTPGLTLNGASVIATTTGSGTVVILEGGTAGDDDLIVTVNTLENGESLTISFTVTIDNAVEDNQVLTNTATLGYDSHEGVGGREGSDSDSASITADLDYDFTKTVVETSAAETAGSEVTIGETVTFELVVTLGEGTTRNVFITDILPYSALLGDNTGTLSFLGAEVFGASANVVSLGNLAVGSNLASGGGNIANIGANGEVVTFNFGTVVVSGADGAGTGTITLRVTAVVVNDSVNQNGDILINEASFERVDVNDNSTQLTGQAAVEVIEPRVEVTKAVTTAKTSLDAGDTVAYQIVLTNASASGATSTAFDVNLQDLLPAGMLISGIDLPVLAGGASVKTALGGTGTNLLSGVFDIPVDGTVTITFTTVLQDSVTPNQSLTNGVNVHYSSLDGNVAGERGGGGVPDPSDNSAPDDDSIPDNYAVGAEDTVTTASPFEVVKTIAATSAGHTGEVGGVEQVAIGEVVTYQLGVTVMQGTTNNLRFEDTVPAGLAIDLGTVAVFDANGMAITNFQASLTGQTLVITIDRVVNPGAVDDPNAVNTGVFTIRYDATVENTAGNQSGTTLTNSVDATADDVDPDLDNEVPVTIVEPVLTLEKTTVVEGRDGGDTVVYDLVITNTGNATAFDILISDILSGSLQLDPLNLGTALSLPAGAPGYAVLDQNGNTAGAVSTLLNQLEAGDSITIRITAQVRADAVAGATVTNEASITYTSLPGTDGGERDGSGTPGENDYTAQDDSESFVLDAPSVVKALFTTSETATAGAEVAIGEIVTYSFLVDLPEGVTPGVVIRDFLPAGLDYTGFTLVTTAAGSNGLLSADYAGTVAVNTVTGGVGSGHDVIFTFGDITTSSDNNAGNNSFVLLVHVVVVNEADNQDGRNLLNEGEMDYTHGTNGVTTVDAGNASVDVVEPDLTVDKEIVSDTSALDAGDTVTYTLTVRHAGGSSADAFDLVLRDVLPAELRDLQIAGVLLGGIDVTAGNLFVINGGFLETPGNVDLARGEELVITISGIVRDNTAVGSGIANTATVLWSSLDGGLSGDDPGVSDGASDERTGEGDPSVNTYNHSDTVETTTRGVLEIVKTADKLTATIGEVVTYTLEITVAEGRTVVDWADQLPAGMVLVPNSVQLGSNPAGLQITGLNAGSLSGQSLTVTSDSAAGTVGNNGATAQNSTFTITYQAVVADVAGNQDGTALTNTVTASADLDGDGNRTDPGEEQTGDSTTTVVEPDLVITKSHNDADGIVSRGQTLTYTIELSHTGASTSSAFDVVFTDVLPPGLTLVAGSVQVNSAGTVTGLTDTSAGSNLSFAASSIGLDGVITVTYQVTVDLGVTPGENIDNTTRVTFTSLDGTVTGERTYEPEPGVEEHDEGNFTDPRQDTERVTIGTAVISDYVWFDLDGDGAQDGNEVGLEGVRVYIDTDNNGAFDPDVDPWALTDPDGRYAIPGLAAGSYTVRVDFSTLPDAGVTVPTYDLNGAPDGVAAAVPLANGQVRDDVDFGFRGTATVGDRIWNDLNGDGVQDPGEPGIEGVTLELIWDSNGNGVVDAGDTVIATATTPLDGSYLFEGLLTGDYLVRVTDTANVLVDADPTWDRDGIATPDVAALSLTTGETWLDVDFGYQGLVGSVSDLVWYDIDGDGQQDAGEVGIPGVTLYIDRNNNGVRDVDEPFAITDADGRYLIGGLVSGNYTMRIEAGTLPPGAIATYDLDGTATANQASFLLGAAEDRSDLDFGLRGPDSIGDRVWADQNRDGIQDPRERGREGVLLHLYWDANGNGVLDAAERANPLASALTDANGLYVFENLFEGDYFIEADESTLKRRWRQTYDLDGINSANTTIVSLTTGFSRVDADFGYYNPPLPPTAIYAPNYTPVSTVEDPGPSSILPGFSNAMVSTYYATTYDPTFDPWMWPAWELIDSSPIFSSPLLSGHAEPGSKVVLALYNHRGELVSTSTVLVGSGGNWTVGFAGVEVNGPITIVSSVAASDFTAFNTDNNFNYRTNYITGMHGGYFQSRNLGVDGAFSNLSYERLEAMASENEGGENTGWLKNDYEFLAEPALPGQ